MENVNFKNDHDLFNLYYIFMMIIFLNFFFLLYQGKILAEGTYQELQATVFDFARLLGSSNFETASDSTIENINTYCQSNLNVIIIYCIFK